MQIPKNICKNVINFVKKKFYFNFAGYDVRAFVRNKALVPEEYLNKTDIVVGNVTSYDTVLNAITGRDEVVVVLGTRNFTAK